MEHILISPGKLKLMLTKSDLDKYHLDTAELEGEHTHTRRAFRALLSDVKRVAGFDAASDKVFIQLYPSRDGGAEIYITRLIAAPEDTRESRTPVTAVYRFPSMDTLLAACSHADTAYPPSHSSAWYGDDGAYYLIITNNAGLPHERLRAGMRVFGHALTSTAASAYVSEHASCIIENDALSTLRGLA